MADKFVDKIYTNWYDYCGDIVKRGDLSSFKVHPNIEYMTEHNILQQFAKEWFGQIAFKLQNLGIISMEIIYNAIKKNEVYGGSLKNITIENTLECNSNSIKYVNMALEVILDFKQRGLNKIKMIEVGGGYGGFSLILHELVKSFDIELEEYIMIDLDNVVELQKMYLEANNITTSLTYVKAHNVESLKLEGDYYFFSSYSLSEIPREIRHKYYDCLFKNVLGGIIYWNIQDIDLLGFNFVAYLEKPTTGIYNRIVKFNRP